MSELHVTYLATDAIMEGIGASQILRYVERLPERGVAVDLHTFEKTRPDTAVAERLRTTGVRWHPHDFGRYGTAGGIQRMLTAARAARGAALVHARADHAAASALLARQTRWVWDVRGLWVDQRVALGTIRPGAPEERIFRRVERQACRRSTAMVTITRAVIPVLAERHNVDVERKAIVVTTCVDLDRFAVRPLPPVDPLRVLLAGTLNRYYDVPYMVLLVDELRRRRPTTLVVATPGETSWEPLLATADERIVAAPSDMPNVVAGSHVGLCVCRDDAGISLVGSMPTKIGEFLACGRPIVVNSLLGDAAALARQERVGVVVDTRSPASIRKAADALEELLDDESLSERCRAVAEQRFDVEAGVDALVDLYARVDWSA